MLILVMVIAGFAIPSPGAGTPGPGFSDNSQYHPLGKPATPEELIIPQIKLKAPILPIEIASNGTLYPPSDYHEVGWWTGSAKPGATSGQTLITGHTVHTGGGVMDLLGTVKPGDIIKVKTKIGTVEYLATKTFVYTKAQLAKHKQDLFGQDRKDYRLVLVTCTGWTGTEYTSNIIVLADELGVANGAGDKSDSDSTFQNAAAAGR